MNRSSSLLDSQQVLALENGEKRKLSKIYIVPEFLAQEFEAFRRAYFVDLTVPSLYVGAAILMSWVIAAMFGGLAVPPLFVPAVSGLMVPSMLVTALILARCHFGKVQLMSYMVITIGIIVIAAMVTARSSYDEFRAPLFSGYLLMLVFVYFFSPLASKATYCLAAFAHFALNAMWFVEARSLAVFIYGNVFMLVFHAVGVAGRVTWGRRLEHEFCLRKLKEFYAECDPLTHGLRRRPFTAFFNEARHQVERDGEQIYLALVDVDRFKALNDAVGHVAGDKALEFIASLLRQQCVEPQDCLCRLGGDEFALLLHRTDAEKFEHRINLVQKMLAEHALAKISDREQISLSIGLAKVHPGQSFETCCARADKAMYKAKTAGRARMFEWQDEAGNAPLLGDTEACRA
ncbi:MAG: GGDEF domain-containing protein [Gammaproteobacteria bacterium]|nr:GGDEF domain-containing protein [Gammaproteobacteria bacterium]